MGPTRVGLPRLSSGRVSNFGSHTRPANYGQLSSRPNQDPPVSTLSPELSTVHSHLSSWNARLREANLSDLDTRLKRAHQVRSMMYALRINK